jgi:hypothetical protein
MSEQTQEHTETRAERRAREAAERAAAGNAEQGNTEQGNTEQTAPDLAALAALDENADDLTDEDRAAFAALDDKQRAKITELREVAAVQGFAQLPEDADVRKASQPVRNRKPVQIAMDAVAQQAYADWVAAGRPVQWGKMPVVTYFIDPDTEDGKGSLADYRKWIRAAVLVAVPEAYDKDGKTIEPSGVRVKWGKDFVLTPKMATKIGKPEHAGKTVLAWAAIDRRLVTSNGE